MQGRGERGSHSSNSPSICKKKNDTVDLNWALNLPENGCLFSWILCTMMNLMIDRREEEFSVSISVDEPWDGDCGVLFWRFGHVSSGNQFFRSEKKAWVGASIWLQTEVCSWVTVLLWGFSACSVGFEATIYSCFHYLPIIYKSVKSVMSRVHFSFYQT